MIQLIFFLIRSKEYNPKGRNQTLDEAIAIDSALLGLLQQYSIPYHTYDTCNVSIQSMLNDLILT